MEDQTNDLEDVKINWRRQKSRPYYLTVVILIANLSMISHGQAAGKSSFLTPDFWDEDSSSNPDDDGWGLQPDNNRKDFNKWFSKTTTYPTS